MKTRLKIILITQSIIIAGLVIFSYSMFENESGSNDSIEDKELQTKQWGKLVQNLCS